MPCGICRASMPIQVFSGAVGFLEKNKPGAGRTSHQALACGRRTLDYASARGNSLRRLFSRIVYLVYTCACCGLTLNVGASQLPGIPCTPSKGKSRAVLINCSSRCFILHKQPFKCHEEVLPLQPMIQPKRFDIFPPVWDAQKV